MSTPTHNPLSVDRSSLQGHPEITGPRSEPGSFRDSTARVFYIGENVYRFLGHEAKAAFERLEKTKFFLSATSEGSLIGTKVSGAGLPHFGTNETETILLHERLPFVSYPYEWSFEMLKDAALLQLGLLRSALAEDMTLKDASAFNSQFRGNRAVFIDVSSFVPWEPGQLWSGYQQFCEMFLYPLFLSAYRGLPPQTFYRCSITGLDTETCYRLLSFASLLRPGVFKHVVLQRLLQRSTRSSPNQLRKEVFDIGAGKQLIEVNAKALEQLLSGLRRKQTESIWLNYEEDNSYREPEETKKTDFIRTAVSAASPALLWDLGCNTGRYSLLASESAQYVVAFDSSEAVIDRLYLRLKHSKWTNVLPLVMDLCNPTSGLGWNSTERRGLLDRGRPDMVLALALVHHLVISQGIPLEQVVEWLAKLSDELVIEYVGREDSKVKLLLQNKLCLPSEYSQEYFEALISKRFEVLETCPLLDGDRVLYHCRKS